MLYLFSMKTTTMRHFLALTLFFVFLFPASASSETNKANFSALDYVGTKSKTRFDLRTFRQSDTSFISENYSRLTIFTQAQLQKTTAVYISLPLSLKLGESDQDLAMGAIEIGQNFRLPLTIGYFFVRAGMQLPTSSTKDANISMVQNSIHSRITDYVSSFPACAALRASASYTISNQKLFAQIDLGADLPFYQRIEGDLPNEVYHLNIGVGYTAKNFSATGEIVSIRATVNNKKTYLHTAGTTLFLNTTRRINYYVGLHSSIMGGDSFPSRLTGILGFRLLQ